MESNIEKIKLVVQAKLGAKLFDCIKESIVLAIESNSKVELFHNCHSYIATPSSLIDVVIAEKEKGGIDCGKNKNKPKQKIRHSVYS